MKNILFIVFILTFSYVNATDYVSAIDGSFSDSDTWTPRGVPTENDNISISHHVDLDEDFSTKKSLVITASGALETNDKSLRIKNNGQFTVQGSVKVKNLTFDNGSEVVVESTGIIEVTDEFENKNNSDNVVIDGLLNVEGDFKNGNGGKIIGGGEICVSGDFDGDGETFGRAPTSTITSGTCIKSGVLPVKLINFEAMLNSNDVLINWSTASELNNKHFNILRSTNGLDFEVIATIEGAGNSSASISYSYSDVNPPKSTLYYLLKQVDFDGKSETFNLISISNESTNYECSMSVNPNPCIGKCTVAFDNCNDYELKDAKFQVYDAMGNVVFASSNKPIEQGKAMFSLDVNNNLKPAIYIVRGNTESKVIDKKVIMQKN